MSEKQWDYGGMKPRRVEEKQAKTDEAEQRLLTEIGLYLVGIGVPARKAAQIRDRVMALLREFAETPEAEETIVWEAGAAAVIEEIGR